MSEPLKSTHVRLSAEAYRVLCALADLNEKDNAEMLRLIAEEAILGRVHTLMMAAERVRCLGFTGISRDLGGLTGSGRK